MGVWSLKSKHRYQLTHALVLDMPLGALISFKGEGKTPPGCFGLRVIWPDTYLIHPCMSRKLPLFLQKQCELRLMYKTHQHFCCSSLGQQGASCTRVDTACLLVPSDVQPFIHAVQRVSCVVSYNWSVCAANVTKRRFTQ